MNLIVCPAVRFVRILPVILLGLGAPLYSAENPASAPPATAATAPATAPVTAALTEPQKAAMDTLDRVIAHYEIMVNRDDDTKHQAAAKVVLNDFKKRRDTLHQNFDQGHYDDLRVELTLESQRLAAWLATPTTPPPVAKARPAALPSAPSTTQPQPAAPH